VTADRSEPYVRWMWIGEAVPVGRAVILRRSRDLPGRDRFDISTSSDVVASSPIGRSVLRLPTMRQSRLFSRGKSPSLARNGCRPPSVGGRPGSWP